MKNMTVYDQCCAGDHLRNAICELETFMNLSGLDVEVIMARQPRHVWVHYKDGDMIAKHGDPRVSCGNLFSDLEFKPENPTPTPNPTPNYVPPMSGKLAERR